MLRTIALTAFVAALALAACAAPPVALQGTNWVLSSLDGRTDVGAAAGGRDVTMEFGADGRVSGSGGCNGYGGEYTAEGGSLQISGVISTLMACEPELVTQNESAFFTALAEVTNFQMAGDTLTLTGGGHTLVFTR